MFIKAARREGVIGSIIPFFIISLILNVVLSIIIVISCLL